MRKREKEKRKWEEWEDEERGKEEKEEEGEEGGKDDGEKEYKEKDKDNEKGRKEKGRERNEERKWVLDEVDDNERSRRYGYWVWTATAERSTTIPPAGEVRAATEHHTRTRSETKTTAHEEQKNGRTSAPWSATIVTKKWEYATGIPK